MVPISTQQVMDVSVQPAEIGVKVEMSRIIVEMRRRTVFQRKINQVTMPMELPHSRKTVVVPAIQTQREDHHDRDFHATSDGQARSAR